MTRMKQRVSREMSLRDYPSGCVYCGHAVTHLSTRTYEPGSEALFCDRPRGHEDHSTALAMCANCATGDHRPCPRWCPPCARDTARMNERERSAR